MLTPKLPEEPKALVASPTQVELILAEDGGRPLSYVLPPFEDIAEMEALSQLNFSLRELAERADESIQRAFKDELRVLLEKYSKYSNSPIYLNRLASIAGLAGDRASEAKYVMEALKISNEPYFFHRYLDNLIYRGDKNTARNLLVDSRFPGDLGTNLRLAYLSVIDGDYSGAEKYVQSAIEINEFDFGARLFEGGLHHINRRFDRAVKSFRLSIEQRPGSAVAHCNLGITYIALRKKLKALSCFKKSVALNPINANAVCLLADLAFSLNRDEEAIPSLRYFVEYEQKLEAVWSRLARACYRIGKYDECIAALKRQGSLAENGAVWSNLGAAYIQIGSTKRAADAFCHAMRLEFDSRNRSYFIAARNYAQMLSDQKKIDELERFCFSIISDDSERIAIKDPIASDLLIFYIHSLIASGKQTQAMREISNYLTEEGVSDNASVWMVGTLAATQAFFNISDDQGILRGFYGRGLSKLDNVGSKERERYLNNVAFALAELGSVPEAESYLSRIAYCVHKSAYPTATFGLIQFKKGHADRAIALYEEAIALADGHRDKIRIRQKLNLELGKLWLSRDEKKGKRLLARVVKEKEGESALVLQAQNILRTS